MDAKFVKIIETHCEANGDVLLTFWSAVEEVLETKRFRGYSLFVDGGYRSIRCNGEAIAEVQDNDNVTHVLFTILKPWFEETVKAILGNQILNQRLSPVLEVGGQLIILYYVVQPPKRSGYRLNSIY